MHAKRVRKRVTRSSISDSRKKGSCKELRPCGMEAACRQLDSELYECVCPHDNSVPNEDLKCPKRLTVPVSPKPLNLSITKQYEQIQVKPNAVTTVVRNNNNNNNRTVQSPVGPPVINQTASVLPNLLGIAVQLNVLILVSIVVAVVLLIFILVVCWSRKLSCCRKSKAKKKSPVALIKNMIQEESYVMNPIYTSPDEHENKYMVPHLSRKSISSMEEIGQGFFGKVFKAFLTHPDGKIEMVAVKVLKNTANPEAREDFKRETEIMTYFRHPNILTLLGVCPEADNTCPWMIFEYMPYGDLTEVLRNSSDKFTSYSFHLPVLDSDALLKISLQIAAGMKYLASQRFVHRDLACRNCLVTFNLVVKIADFGMSRDIYTCDYYTVGGNRLLPVRWMSPECIVYGKFTLESDVWSYGVVLWEIYSFGKQPYYGTTNDEALKLVKDSVLLEIPLNCPPLICVLMNGCWKSDPKERLRFTDIHDRLKNAAVRAELDSSLPRPPALPAIMDHLSMRKMSSVRLQLDDEDDYLRIVERPPGRNREDADVGYVVARSAY